MQKQAPSIGRIFVMVLFAMSCFGILLYLWLVFGGSTPLKPQGYRVKVNFPEATQLAQEADVRISGVPVGRVKKKELDDESDTTSVEIELDDQYAPIPADTRAVLRQKTLLGETYVELTPGTKDGPMVDDGGTLAAGQVSPTVELDEIFRAFDAKTREAFRVWLDQQGRAFEGRGEDINDALGNLAPFAEDTNEILEILDRHERATQQLVRDTGEVFAALTERQGQLQQLIVNSNRALRGDRRARRGAGGDLPDLPDLPRRVARHHGPPDGVRERHRPAGHAAAAGRARAVAHADLAGRPGARPEGVLPRPRPADHRVEEGPARARGLPQRDDAAARADRPVPARSSTRSSTTSATTSPRSRRSSRTTWRRRRRPSVPLGGDVPVHYLRTTNPVNPENLAA